MMEWRFGRACKEPLCNVWRVLMHFSGRANLTDSTRKMIEWSGRDIQRWAALVAQTTASEVGTACQKLSILV
jgi:hypothetical protein